MAIILADGDPKVLQMDLLYARNVIRNGWMKETALCLFGPSEGQVVADARSHELLSEIIAAGTAPRACRYGSDEHPVSEALEALGCKVVSVGEAILNAIDEGFVPRVCRADARRQL